MANLLKISDAVKREMGLKSINKTLIFYGDIKKEKNTCRIKRMM